MGESKGRSRTRADQGGHKPKDEHESFGSSRVRISKNEEIVLDHWQKEVLETKGLKNLTIRAGRQVGKSTVISLLAGRYAVENINQSIMIISSTERQAFLLFSKVLSYLHDNYRNYIKMGKNRPTKTQINLNNGSVIRCLPTGLDGLGIRGYTVNLLIADEAAFIPQDVWAAVTPMLATTGGKIILLSTPFGRQGYFYERFFDDDFLNWHISSEEVAEKREEPQRSNMRSFQEKEKNRMTHLQYSQEYLGEFVDELRQLFTDKLIKQVCTLRRPESFGIGREFYLGVDIARLGDDESTFEILRKINNDKFEHVESIVTKKQLTTNTYDKILELNKQYDFKKIGIDAGSGSLGVGILDFLLRSEVKRKVVALNNIKRELDHRGERKRSILKEDMYLNLLALLEKGKIDLLADDEVIESLRSVQYEYVITKNKISGMRIFGKYTHIAEGLIRAAWLANQKTLSSFIDYI